MTDVENRRESTRALAHVQAVLVTRGGSEFRGIVIDLSLNGVFLGCKETVPEGTDCELTLTLGGTDSPIAALVRGTVVRTGPSGTAVHLDEILGVDSYHHLRNLVLYNAADPGQVEAEFQSHIGLKARAGPEAT